MKKKFTFEITGNWIYAYCVFFSNGLYIYSGLLQVFFLNILTVFKRSLLYWIFRLLLKRSGLKTPRIEVEEIGPSFDFTLRRSHLASESLYKDSLRRPKMNQVNRASLKRIQWCTILFAVLKFLKMFYSTLSYWPPHINIFSCFYFIIITIITFYWQHTVLEFKWNSVI